MKKLLTLLIGAALLSGTLQLPVTAQDVGDVVDVVLNVGATENDVNITWYTTGSIAKLQLARKSNYVNGVFPENSCAEYVAHTRESGYVASYGDETNDVTYYSNSIMLSGLTAGTEYVYRVSSLDAEGEVIWSNIYEYTVQNVAAGYGFLVVGDPQIGSETVDSDTARWENTMTQALGTMPNASFLLSVGDQINSAGNSEDQVEQNFAGFLSENAKLTGLPVATSVGNHDNSHAQAYSSHFTLPNLSSYGSTSDTVTGEEDYYFTYGNTLFIMLNTNNSGIEEHKQFIEQTIAANNDCTWKVVVLHQSIYSVARHVNDGNIAELREGLSPIFYENDIDVVLMGHDHVYARSYIMGGAGGTEAVISTKEDGSALTEIVDAEGVQYVTFNSGSGSKYYPITAELYTYTAVHNQENVPNYSCVSVDDNSFTIATYRSTDNSLVDTITLIKSNVLNPGGETSY